MTVDVTNLLTASPLIYGCMKIGGAWNSDPLTPDVIRNALACVKTALDCGITFFDHADIYTLGKGEEAFSHSWSELGLKRADVILQTKCGIRRAQEPAGAPHRLDLSEEHILRSVDASLKRLKTDYLDVLLLHRPDPLAEREEIARAFDRLMSEKLVRQFGVSNYNGGQIAVLQKALSQKLIANQVEFNLLHNSLVDEGVTVNNDQRRSYRGDGTLEYCTQEGVRIQAYSPIARGRLTPAAHDADDRTRGAAHAVASMAQRKGLSGEAILVSWILRHPARIQPVLGSANPGRIRAACAGTSITLTREEWYELYLAGRGEDIP